MRSRSAFSSFAPMRAVAAFVILLCALSWTACGGGGNSGASSGTITTVAGNNNTGFFGDNGLATLARLNAPAGVTVDASGNFYIADSNNNRIRKVDSKGIITTVAGSAFAGYSGDHAAATSAMLNGPVSVAVDGSGNLYIADQLNNVIRKVTSAGIITTFAGTGVAGYNGDNIAAATAQLNLPSSVAVDSSGNVFIADYSNQRIREVVAASGNITTVAGTGTAGFSGNAGAATAALLSAPIAIALDSTGNLYICDSGNNRIRKVAGGNISTIAGNGTAGSTGDNAAATSAELANPTGVAVDASGNVFISDTVNQRVRKVSGTNIYNAAGIGTAGFAGDGASALRAELNGPFGLAVDSKGNLYIADSRNQAIRKVTF